MGQRKQFAQSIYGAEPQSMTEVGFAVIALLNSYKSSRYSARGMVNVSEKLKCVGLAWHLVHSKEVSNSHSSPEGYPTNFAGNGKNAPRGYPGWQGRVWVRYDSEAFTFGSDPFGATLTHTGTGGGGSYDGPWKEVTSTQYNRFGRGKDANIYPAPCVFSWDFKIFDLDWPEIAEIKDYAKSIRKWKRTVLKKHNEQAMLVKLEGGWISTPSPLPQPNHNFLWEEAETKAKDDAFLFDCRRVIHQKEVLSLLR